MLRKYSSRRGASPQPDVGVPKRDCLVLPEFGDVVRYVEDAAAEHPKTAHREPPILRERASVIAGLLLGEQEGLTREVTDLRWKILSATGSYPELPISVDPDFMPDNALLNDLRRRTPVVVIEQVELAV
jgi:hypothetical protein